MANTNDGQILYNLTNGIYTTRYWTDTKETLTVENMHARLENYKEQIKEYQRVIGVSIEFNEELKSKVTELEMQIKELSVQYELQPRKQQGSSKSIKRIQGRKPKLFTSSQIEIIKASNEPVQEKAKKYKCSRGTIYKIMHDKY